MHGNAVVIGLRTTSSDYATILLETKEDKSSGNPKPFRFEMAWLKDEGCDKVVQDFWQDFVVYGFPDCLSICGQRLRLWGGDRVSKFGKEIATCRKRLD